MTREEAKELLPIIKAYSEGKEIEYEDYDGEWGVLGNPLFKDKPNKYRIKLETKYRPFKSVEECFNEMSKHQPLGWLIDIGEKHYTHITILGKSTDFNYLFKNKTFIDGTPFGIKEEE